MNSLNEIYGLHAIINGLAKDMADLRSGVISVEKAKTQAELAKQIFNGMRLVVTANKFLETEMKRIPTSAKEAA